MSLRHHTEPDPIFVISTEVGSRAIIDLRQLAMVKWNAPTESLEVLTKGGAHWTVEKSTIESYDAVVEAWLEVIR